MKLSNLKTLLALLPVAFAASIHAQNNVVTYQGRVQSGGTDFTGAGQIKFALVTPNTTLARQATATATVANGFVIGYVITDGGAGYTTAPAVTITAPTGSGAAACENWEQSVASPLEIRPRNKSRSQGRGMNGRGIIRVPIPLPNIPLPFHPLTTSIPVTVARLPRRWRGC